ncbi:universal stress protein [Halococcus hamelinensis]|uniref:Stress response protein n=1 Tax=Halococcus hamelinensis 100A6 TaxID=1132509 RepID=M0M7G4_9EURY|nr:universal stress protein [Halococcus hamelinensis]EMA40529.1 stress response protein [Halococcus hamelinensis 100A6]
MNVLLGIDGTDRAFDALERTIARVRETGDDLTVAVVESDVTDPEAVERRIRTMLDDVDIDAGIEQVEGHAGGALVELAEAGGFDRLVLDGGERTPTGKIRLDPTTEFVLLNAETSVTLAR